MTTESLIEIIKRIWARAMPKAVPLPDDYAAFLWSKKHIDDIAYSIQRSGEKMAKLLSDGQTVSIEQAQRYTTSILMSRTEWRKERQVQTEVDGNKEGL
jgi:hypothetical protein